MDKKKMQLGMNPGTAQGRLVKDLLFNLVKDTPCYHCGGVLTRDTFSIEHKTPWLDSDDPAGLFFDLSNISYSHVACNFGAARRPNKKWDSRAQGKREWQRKNRVYNPDKRREQYLRTGQ